MTVDHYRWHSLADLVPGIDPPPSLEEVRNALVRVRERCGGRLPIGFAGLLTDAVGIEFGRETIANRPDTWAAAIKFCNEYQSEKS